MSDTMAWALRTAAGGGALLLLGWWLARRQRVPARRQRLAEVALAAALLVPVLALLPGWLQVTLPPPERAASTETASPPEPADEPDAGVMWLMEEAPAAPDPTPAEAPAPLPPAKGLPWAGLVMGAYAAVSAALLARWLLASFLVHCVLRAARPAPPEAQALFDELRGGRRWRLLVSDRTAVPFSVGLWRPAVVLPLRLLEAATAEEVEWALRHEAAHLRRQDTRMWWLVALGQVVYFYLPWFWWMRRQVRLAQEMVADAEAAPEGLAADYAQFLLSWAAQPPVVATGVSGAGSDLYRRIAMLLQDRSAALGRCPRCWLVGVAGGLVALAVLVTGARLQASAAAEEPEKQAEAKKAKPKRARPGLEGIKGLDEEAMKELRERMDELGKKMAELQKQFPRGGQGGAWALPGGAAQGLFFSAHEGRLGVQVDKPSATLIEQLDLPKNQGLVLRSVAASSAAAKAGMKQHDILLELNGKTVSNTSGGLSKLLEGIKADAVVDAVVLRKGKKETIKGLKLPEAKARAGAWVMPAIPAVPEVAQVPRRPARPAAPKGGTESISLKRTNDEFTTVGVQDGVTITIKGKVAEGKAAVSEVTVDDGKGAKTYAGLDKVPAAHQARAKQLAEMSAAGRVRVGR